MAEYPSTKPKSLRALYEELAPKREPYWQRARDAASLTIPSLFPEMGFNATSEQTDPFQSVGAMGLNSLTSKLLLALFPPGLRFFGIELDPRIRSGGGDLPLEQAEAARDFTESTIQYHIESAGFRVRMTEVIKNMLVAGNVAIQRRRDGKGWRIWRLPQYVASVTGEDELTEIVTKETITKTRLPPNVRARITSKDDPLDLYTGWIRNDEGKFDTWQEVGEERIEGTEGGLFTEETLPITLCRFEPICGESYGRSMIERVIGDLSSLEGIQQSTVELAAEAARIVHLINPNGIARSADLETAPNGSYRQGTEADVFTLSVDKLNDLQIVRAVAEGLRTDLKEAFFMRGAVQRDAERVTAVEISALIQEIESTQGGTYSAMSEEVQTPILRMTVAELQRNGRIDSLSEAPVKMRIIAGLEGLGRAIELDQNRRFLSIAAVLPGDAETGFDLDMRKIKENLARACGLEPKSVLRDREEVAQLRQAAADAAQQAALAPEIVKQGGEMVRESVQTMNGRR